MKRTIVVVDDHEDSRIIYAAILRHGGLAVALGSTGEEGFALAGMHEPAAVVTDLHLPGLDGCTLVRTLRAEPATKRIAALLVTADARPEVHPRAESAGCDAVLLKPHDPRHLLQLVHTTTEARNAT